MEAELVRAEGPSSLLLQSQRGLRGHRHDPSARLEHWSAGRGNSAEESGRKTVIYFLPERPGVTRGNFVLQRVQADTPGQSAHLLRCRQRELGREVATSPEGGGGLHVMTPDILGTLGTPRPNIQRFIQFIVIFLLDTFVFCVLLSST